MNKEEYFFNTYLGRELNVCGDLIYKGFEALENNQQNILNNDYLYQELGIKDSVDFLQEAPAFIFRFTILFLFILLLYYPKSEVFPDRSCCLERPSGRSVPARCRWLM